MKAKIRVETGRVLVTLDIPVEQVSLGKIENILSIAARDVTSPYPKCVRDSPKEVIADMFRNIESQDVLVTSLSFPAVARPVIEALPYYGDGILWCTDCTFTHDSNDVIVAGGDIEIRVPWE